MTNYVRDDTYLLTLLDSRGIKYVDYDNLEQASFAYWTMLRKKDRIVKLEKKQHDGTFCCVRYSDTRK